MKHPNVQDPPSTSGHGPAAFPLALAAAGEPLEIASVRGGEGLQRRLAAMGLYPGCVCEVVQNERPGGVVLRVGESRMGLGTGMVHKILVVPRP